MTKHLLLAFLTVSCVMAQTEKGNVTAKITTLPIEEGVVTVVHLGVGYTTSVRLPEDVSSVVVGNPASFKAEHSEMEPRLVFLKPITSQAVESNALITTKSGQEISLHLISAGQDGGNGAVDFLLEYRRAHSVVVSSSGPQSFLIAEEGPLSPAEPIKANVPAKNEDLVGAELERQRAISSPAWEGKELLVAAGESSQQEHQTLLSFSVLNHSKRVIELLPPQIEFIGAATHKKAKGRIKAEPVAISEYRMTSRRLAPGAHFQRSDDQKTTAKVFVTCEVSVFGLGSHSATGEEWADDPNACTSAEAQSFKRACSCLGLGRYLYHFNGIWVDLDDRKRPKTKPALTGWATPEGWKQGLRPGTEPRANSATNMPDRQDESSHELVRKIEAMAQSLGKGLYRGLLKSVAKAWKPADIKDPTVLEQVLIQMQVAERGLNRLETSYLHTGAEPLAKILQTLGISDMDHLTSLELLDKVVFALEAEAKDRSHGK